MNKIFRIFAVIVAVILLAACKAQPTVDNTNEAATRVAEDKATIDVAQTGTAQAEPSSTATQVSETIVPMSNMEQVIENANYSVTEYNSRLEFGEAVALYAELDYASGHYGMVNFYNGSESTSFKIEYGGIRAILKLGDIKVNAVYADTNLRRLEDPESGEILWQQGARVNPDYEFNALELWSLEYAEKNYTGEDGQNFLLMSWAHGGTSYDDKLFEESGFNPLEVNAAHYAFSNLMESQNLFFLDWNAVDFHYRFLDNESGEVLQVRSDLPFNGLYPMPESGWLKVQIADHDPIDDTDWITEAILNMETGNVVCLEQIGRICGFYPLGWAMEPTTYVRSYWYGKYLTAEDYAQYLPEVPIHED